MTGAEGVWSFGSTETLNDCESDPAALATFSSTAKLPPTSGVQLTAPRCASTAKPGGPEVTEKVSGAVPLACAMPSWPYRYAAPATPFRVGALVNFGGWGAASTATLKHWY